jgi:pimeloyl-ACP methyl ester carboxylesterase
LHPKPELVASPIWQEALFGIEVLLLHASPVYYGFGVPHGDDSAVVIIPGFLLSDFYLVELYAWLRRIGYRPYFSGVGLNADCPNLLIRYQLTETLKRARRETRRKVHLIGHSLGGLLARAVAADRPRDVASVITLGSPFRGAVLHPRVQSLVDRVRRRILATQGDHVLPQCYTGQCTCSFLGALRRESLKGPRETAIYSKTDGVVDWRYCRTEDSRKDFEVTGTHLGLAFHPEVYRIVANRLAERRKLKACSTVG